jgi:hypothetical protein
VDRVDVSLGAGRSWQAATLDPPDGHRWPRRRWHLTWTATPGDYVLTARAGTTDGEAQPTEPVWNRGGFVNNASQRIP